MTKLKALFSRRSLFLASIDLGRLPSRTGIGLRCGLGLPFGIATVLIGEEVRLVSAPGEGEEDGMVNEPCSEFFWMLRGDSRQRKAINCLLARRATGSRCSASAEDMARPLTNRLPALCRAHDLVQPLPGHTKTDALLGDLLSVLLAAYDDLGFVVTLKMNKKRLQA